MRARYLRVQFQGFGWNQLLEVGRNMSIESPSKKDEKEGNGKNFCGGENSQVAVHNERIAESFH